jgi:hypothetical protein
LVLLLPCGWQRANRTPTHVLFLLTFSAQVPATDWEALKSPLMGLFEKRRAAKFFSFVQQYDERNAQVGAVVLPAGGYGGHGLVHSFNPDPGTCHGWL